MHFWLLHAPSRQLAVGCWMHLDLRQRRRAPLTRLGTQPLPAAAGAAANTETNRAPSHAAGTHPGGRAQLQLHDAQREAAGARHRGEAGWSWGWGSRAGACNLLLPCHPPTHPHTHPTPLHRCLATLFQNVHRVSLKKLPYTVVRLPEEQPAGAAAAAAKAGPPADQEQQQQEEEEGSSGSDEEEEEQPEDGSSDEGEQQPGADGSSDEEEDEEEEAMLDAFPPGAAAAVEAFASAVESDPAAFLQPTAELAELAKGAAKALYDYQAAFEADTSSSKGGKSAAAASGALPELYIQGFDAEQIWLQLELAAGPAFKRARRLLKKAGQEPELLTPEMEEAIDGAYCPAGWMGGNNLAGWLGCENQYVLCCAGCGLDALAGC